MSSNDVGRDSKDRTLPTRRKVVGGVGSAFTVALAGCASDGGGGGGDEGTATPTPTPGEDVELIWKNPHGNFEAELNYNPWNPKTHGGNMAQSWIGSRDPRQMKFASENLGGPFSEWEFTRGETVTFHLADLKWHTGDDYVAEDVALHYRLMREAIGEEVGPWQYADQVHAEDDKTLVFELTTTAIWEVIRDSFFSPGIDTPASPTFEFQEHMDALQDASSDDAKQQAKNNLFQKQIPVEDVLEDGPPNGFTPWKPVEVKEKFIVNKLWEEHPWAKDANFDTVYGVNLDLMKQQGIQMIKSGDLDSTKLPLSPQTEEEFRNDPDITVRPAFKLQTTALLMNHAHPILGKPKVRRGLAYMIDREQVARQIFPTEPAEKPYPVPYSRTFIDEYVGDIKDKLFAYETDREKGAQLWRDAGLSKQGGEWVGPDGGSLDIQFVSPPARALDKGSAAISQQLKSLNIPHNFVDKPGSYMWSQGYTQSPPGYDLTVGPWVFGFHPFAGMQIAFLEDGSAPPEIGFPEEFEYPSEIGNLDSQMTSFKPAELLPEIPHMDEQERQQTIEDLTWAYNSQLVSYGINQKHMHHTWRSDHWKIPPKDTLGMGQGHASKLAAKRPLIQAKEEYT